MKRIIFIVTIILCICSTTASAQNPYGFCDESIQFFDEFNVDVNIFAEVFNGEEDAETLENLERNLWSIRAQTRAYSFNEYQVKAMINNEVKRILNYRKVEFVTIPAHKVTFNEQVVDSTARQYPVLEFRGITYFPMTYDDCRFLGVTTNWDDNAKKLTIKKEPVENAVYNEYSWFNNQEKFVYAENVEGIFGDVKNYNFDIEVNGKEVINENEEYPLLLFRNVTYIPLTWRFAVEEFGWEYNYTEENGLVIKS